MSLGKGLTYGSLIPQFFPRQQYFRSFASDNVNSLPNDKILDMTKLKVFTDDKINVAQIMISVSDRVENIVGKGENAGYHNVFKRILSWER